MDKIVHKFGLKTLVCVNTQHKQKASRFKHREETLLAATLTANCTYEERERNGKLHSPSTFEPRLSFFSMPLVVVFL